ncbi:hypothetical protein SOV_18050 [Sporomusa ovata DSM 2662]|uniref:Uncharacterized protein n=1 Tax=Sporomusa ovata TaxID=2378 RepID=A0A0U1KVI4_9FIRM|nr:hypothetical protein [Sporomusa ovata]EQB29404.1 hypothetical protein SOV_1c11380 [Sporomusa ovata DSM 2662]CQR71452.1 hypothetical protein SpAn4DRAFT_3957 [Sporomusa ovata]
MRNESRRKNNAQCHNERNPQNLEFGYELSNVEECRNENKAVVATAINGKAFK